jgi:hypothetical protein
MVTSLVGSNLTPSAGWLTCYDALMHSLLTFGASARFFDGF